MDLRRALGSAYDSVKLPGAIWMTWTKWRARHEEIPRDKDVVLYCS